MCQFGATKPAVFSMVGMLHTMEQHICMVFGDSGQYANWTYWHAPIAGIGQGNRAGLQIWAAVMLLITRDYVNGWFFHTDHMYNVWCKERYCGLCFCWQHWFMHVRSHSRVFQDSSIVAGFGYKPGKGYSRQLGACIPNKCSWYLIDQMWQKGRWIYKQALKYQLECW